MVLVWDIKLNHEIYSYSSSSATVVYLNGPNTKSGYIIDEDKYVNLDNGLTNYFFEYTFYSYAWQYSSRNGYKINKNQDVILENGALITKETIIEVTALDEIIQEITEIDDSNVSYDRIRFQVDGNTSLHYYALEYETLSIILDYFEEHKPHYLTAILMKNSRGKSPIDIAIDNESPKNIELFLNKLALFEDIKLSSIFYTRFSELLSMNISAFHAYLDSCFFQTVQMKETKFLDLKSEDDPLLVSHSS